MAICHRRRRKAGAPLLRSSKPSQNSAGGSTTATGHYLRITSRLRSETGDGDIRRLFNTASALHENFYENEMETADVADGLDDVEALINKLIPLLSQT